jgi:hypothetical protein
MGYPMIPEASRIFIRIYQILKLLRGYDDTGAVMMIKFSGRERYKFCICSLARSIQK